MQSLKAFLAVFFAHPIVPQNPGIVGLNPTGGVTFFRISLFLKFIWIVVKT